MSCAKDIAHLLENYERSLSDVLYEHQISDEQVAENIQEYGLEEQMAQEKICEEDASRVEEAQTRYLNALEAEQHAWYQREEEIRSAHLASRRSELEAVERHLAVQGRKAVEEALVERCDQHCQMLSVGAEQVGGENRLHVAEKAKQEWTTEVCKAVIMEMRKEWRSGQRKVLQQLAGELRAERKAACDALDRQISMSKKVSETVKGMWQNEISQAQEQLDEVAEAYKRALKFALEAKLREARQHAKEQAEFFQKEIREALMFEQQEHAAHQAQLRRMRLAMLKWRFDYLDDAKRKAAEFVCRGVLAKLSGLSNAQPPAKKKKKKDADPDLATGEQTKSLKPGGLLEDGAEAEDGGIPPEPKTLGKKPKDGSKSPGGGGKAGHRGSAKVGYADYHSESSEELSSEEESEDEEGEEGEEEALVDGNWGIPQDLVDCRLVIEKLWARLANPEVDAIDFCFSLEDLIPYEEEILLMYEEELMKHGVMCTLDATDGRAEEAFQAEKEAALAKARDTETEKEVVVHRKKKNTKPGVPTVKRRVQLLP